MEKKESLKDNRDKLKTDTGAVKKPSWVSNRVFDIIKLFLGICLLPFVYSSTRSFLMHISYIDISLQQYFWSGVIAFLLFYLFVFEPAWAYNWGHKLLEFIFSFFQPLVRVAPYLLPVYVIVIFLIYLILSLFISEKWLINYSMFLWGVSLALHLVFSSKTIRSKKGDILKSNYIFGFSFIYIINLSLFALFLNIAFSNFSFVSFVNDSYCFASRIFKAVFFQLFKV